MAAPETIDVRTDGRTDRMPALGLGTYGSFGGDGREAVRYAVEEAGYRHLDCAPAYFNEKFVGEAVRDLVARGVVRRDELWLTTKLANADHAPERVRAAVERSAADLGAGGYVDLLLLHWPFATDEGGEKLARVPLHRTWAAMEGLVRDGLVRHLGVSNMPVALLHDLLSYAELPPAVNQLECHPMLPQDGAVRYCLERGIAVVAHSPLGSAEATVDPGAPNLREQPEVLEVAARHGGAGAACSVLLRWQLDRGLAAVPKSVQPAHILANARGPAALAGRLTDADRASLAALARRPRRFLDTASWAPGGADFFA